MTMAYRIKATPMTLITCKPFKVIFHTAV